MRRPVVREEAGAMATAERNSQMLELTGSQPARQLRGDTLGVVMQERPPGPERELRVTSLLLQVEAEVFAHVGLSQSPGRWRCGS
jgi:hypothetical protein